MRPRSLPAVLSLLALLADCSAFALVARAEETAAPVPAPVEVVAARTASPIDPIREDLLALHFEAALAAIDALLRDPALPEPTRLEALVIRSQAHAATGAFDAAEKDFGEILEADPAFEPEAAAASKKAIARFEKAKAARVGVLRLDLDPPDAAILVDGRPARKLAGGLLPVLAGNRVLRLDRKGFDSLERRIDAEAGKETPFVIRMVPNSRSVVVRTDPPGVRVTVDGNLAGETALPRAGPPGAPAELAIEEVVPGEHGFTLEKSCYRTVQHHRMVTVDLMDRAPLAFDLVVLDPARSRLTLRGTIPGSEVRVDGTAAGSLPLEPLDLCPGPKELEVRAGGRVVYWDRPQLPEEGGLEVEIRPRPNLERFGAVWPADLGPFAASFNARPIEPLPRSVDPTSPAAWASLRLAPDTDLAIAVLPAADGGQGVRRLLFSPLLRTVDVLEGALPDTARPAWWRSASGMRIADSGVWGKAVVVEVVPGGGAAAAGVSVGDRVLSVGSSAVEDARQAVEALRNAPPGSEIEVRLAGAKSAPRTVRIRTAATPVVPVPAGAAGAAVTAAWAAADGAVPGDDAAPALANLAMLLSGASRHDLASETLRKIAWGDRNGIGGGTVAYLLGREMEAQGLEAEARAAFLRARETASTTQDDEGLDVAPAAADHLADLGVGSEPAAGKPTGR